VLDIPGGAGKVPVGPNYISACDQGGSSYEVVDPAGRRHAYPAAAR
jgi:lysine 2,3-aminomutase